MRVLLVFPQQDRQTGLFIKKALVRLGHTVRVVDPKVEPDMTVPAANVFKPDMILYSRTPDLAPHIHYIKHKLKSKAICVCWNTDVRKNLDGFFNAFGIGLDKLWQNTDIICTMAKGQVGEYAKRYPQARVLFLSQGIDPDVHNRKKFLSDDDIDKYKCDIVFMGNYLSTKHNFRKELLETIGSRYDLKLWGRKNKIFDLEHSKACQGAKIVLGNSAFPNIECSMSVRDYKVMGAGGFLLTNNVKGEMEFFENCIDTYDSIGDCINKIEYWLKNEDLRVSMAKKGMELVHAKHTYYHRIKYLMDYLNTPSL